MSTPDPTQLVKGPAGWAKARPVVFIFLVLVIVLLTIRYREKIALCLAKVPGIGGWLTGLARVGAVLIGLASLGGLA